MRFGLFASCLCVVLGLSAAYAQLPQPPQSWGNWSMPWGENVPGVVSAEALLDKPAGKAGPVVVREGHFYSGEKRLRFWGVNICFSGCFPTHAQADAVARRLARFGINAVRFHHMDMQPFPRGIFTDGSLEKLSPEALDRLDYFIAALKKEGIYANINLHVSRHWSKAHKWPNADKTESFDKMIDLFHPELIDHQKTYARDLLNHVNAYTKSRYADEPAIAMVEINNEDGLFIWGGEKKIADMPEPYAGLFKKLWNQWLLEKYGSRQKLQEAWNVGAKEPGANLLKDPAFAALGTTWKVEQHAPAKMSAAAKNGVVTLTIPAAVEPAWHLQFNQGKLPLAKGRHYTVRFTARADKAAQLDLSVAQAHEPWNNMGLSAQARLTDKDQAFFFGFTASADEPDARLSFSLGRQAATIALSQIEVFEGGQTGLRVEEDPAQGSVAPGLKGRPDTQARLDDWYAFIQATDEKYFVNMYRYLKDELGVKAPITGTIGFGPLGTLSQSRMDFIDQHAYWDHPRFPRRPWDGRDWLISNKPMVDAPERATLWGLAATRVLGKPFTVTEYNHAAPNEWEAECIPMIAAYAALQDWDGIFIFGYSHNDQFEKGFTTSYFDIEGNPQKMALMPLAARVFLGSSLRPSAGSRVAVLKYKEMLAEASRFWNEEWGFLRHSTGMTWEEALSNRLYSAFDSQVKETPAGRPSSDPRVGWSSGGAGTGRFFVRDERAAIFVGFAAGSLPIDLGVLRIEQLQTPFAAIMLVPADPAQTLESADRLLLATVARGQNTGMTWDAARSSVSNRWGQAPAQIEPVKARLSLKSSRPLSVRPLSPEGQVGQAIPGSFNNGQVQIDLTGGTPTVWYELRRE